MKLDLPRAAATAWGLFRRDADVMVALGGLFLFVPALALLLLVPAPPPPVAANAGEAAVEQWLNLYIAWARAYAPGLLAAAVTTLFGALTITVFVIEATRPSVGRAMVIALRLLPRFAVLVAGVAMVGTLGLLAFVLPGLWLMGRTMLIAPALVADGANAPGPLVRSLRLTRGNDLPMAGVAAIGLFGGQVLAAPLLALDEALRESGANALAITATDAGVALIEASVALAIILLRVTLYGQAAGQKAA